MHFARKTDRRGLKPVLFVTSQIYYFFELPPPSFSAQIEFMYRTCYVSFIDCTAKTPSMP